MTEPEESRGEQGRVVGGGMKIWRHCVEIAVWRGEVRGEEEGADSSA